MDRRGERNQKMGLKAQISQYIPTVLGPILIVFASGDFQISRSLHGKSLNARAGADHCRASFLMRIGSSLMLLP